MIGTYGRKSYCLNGITQDNFYYYLDYGDTVKVSYSPPNDKRKNTGFIPMSDKCETRKVSKREFMCSRSRALLTERYFKL